MKKLPIEQRKASVSVALSQLALGKLEIMSDRMQDSRSGIVEAAIGLYYRFYQVYGPDRSDWMDEDPQPPEIPDDVSEIGYNPFSDWMDEDPQPPEIPDDVSEIPDDVSEIPDDVSEIGYNPFTGSYEEDL